MNRKSKPIKIIWKLYFRILVNPMLLVDNPTMTEYLCKNERSGPQTTPKENKSKSFYNSKLLKNVFFIKAGSQIFYIFFRWKVSELIINGVQRQDDGLYECQARNEGGQFFKSGHIQVCTFSWNTRFWHFFCSLKFLNKCSVVKNSAYFLSMCNSKRHTDFDIRYHEGIFLLKKFWWWVVISPEFSIIFLSSPRPWHYFLLFLAPLWQSS